MIATIILAIDFIFLPPSFIHDTDTERQGTAIRAVDPMPNTARRDPRRRVERARSSADARRCRRREVRGSRRAA